MGLDRMDHDDIAGNDKLWYGNDDGNQTFETNDLFKSLFEHFLLRTSWS